MYTVCSCVSAVALVIFLILVMGVVMGVVSGELDGSLSGREFLVSLLLRDYGGIRDKVVSL